jgi:hypothetical protein
MSTVYIGLRQLKAPSVSPRDRRACDLGCIFASRCPFAWSRRLTRNLISLVSVLSTPTRGLGAVLAAHAGSYSHVRFVRRGLAKAASRRLQPAAWRK